MEKIDAAFLVYKPLKQRRKDNSFDGNDNIGAKVIYDVLTRAGYKIGFCAPETARKYPLVLVSFTSSYDYYAYYKSVALRPDWQPKQRPFKILAGGFGMQNPTVIRHYLDAAAFGRAESFVGQVVADMLDGKTPSHPSVMASFPDITPVVYSQAETLYPYQVGDWQEEFTGCPHKCKFCHYTFAREYKAINQDRNYVQGTLTSGSSPELTWDQVITYPKKAGRIRTAWDGFSERLRFILGKRISNSDIVSGLENVGSYAGTSVLDVYNISNFPTESPYDVGELYDLLNTIEPKNRVVLVLFSTPFRPSILTPMQWEPVDLQSKVIKLERVVDKKNFMVTHPFWTESKLSHLMNVIVDRAKLSDSKLFHTLCFSPTLRKLSGDAAVAAIKRNFDITHILKQYDFDEPHPADFLTGVVKRPVLEKIAKKMRAELAIPYQEWKLPARLQP